MSLTELSATVADFQDAGFATSSVLPSFGGQFANASFSRIQAGLFSAVDAAASADIKYYDQVIGIPLSSVKKTASVKKPAAESLVLKTDGGRSLRFFDGEGLTEPEFPAYYLSDQKIYDMFKNIVGAFPAGTTEAAAKLLINTPLKKTEFIVKMREANTCPVPLEIIKLMSIQEKRDWVVGALKKVGLAS